MSDLSGEFKEAVRAKTDIVALIGESVALKSINGGREFVGLCPFHDDKNPSLRVYPDRQTYRCWSCQAGGDCFTFVMEESHLDFRSALESLAKSAGLEMPKSMGRRELGEGNFDKPAILEALLWAQHLFHKTLMESPLAKSAREYLQSRQFTRETVTSFKLGYHPNNWDWLQQECRGRFTPEQLESARLIGRRENGGFYDNFVNRVLFPIWDERGNPVAFGGRVLPGDDDSHGKYWNSPESPVFHKSRLVYALNRARDAIKATGTAVVTEGYTDCIAAHQAGIANAVGTLGTALTDQHVTTLKRFSRKVVLVYDGDEAGRNAAERAIERFLTQDTDLRILTLPDGQDPAEFLEARGPEAFQQLVDTAPEAWEYKFAAVQRKHGLQTVDGRQRVLEEMLSLLSVVPKMSEHVREGLLLSALSQRLHVSEQQVRDRYKEIRSGVSTRGNSGRPSGFDESPEPHEEIARILQGRATTDDIFELPLLESLCAAPECVNFLQRGVKPELLQNRALRRLLVIGLQFASGSETLTFERYCSAIEHPQLKQLAVWIDEQARRKNVRNQLAEMSAGDGCPLFLRRSIESLSWRREEQSQQQAAVELSAGEGSRNLDAEAEALLRQASEFHQRRATRKITG
ncbi:MAG: DNA primase [Planctomycetaceae bacterium]